MRIDKNLNVQRAMKLYDNKNSKKWEAKKSSKESGDKLELSSKAQEFKVAMGKLKELDEVREHKVKEIKSRIDSGNYNVSSEDLAKKIVDQALSYKKI